MLISLIISKALFCAHSIIQQIDAMTESAKSYLP